VSIPIILHQERRSEEDPTSPLLTALCLSLSLSSQVSALTFVRHVKEHVSGEMEELYIRTIGVKGLEVHTALAKQSLPFEASPLLSLSLSLSLLTIFSTAPGRELNDPSQRSRGAVEEECPGALQEDCLHCGSENLSPSSQRGALPPLRRLPNLTSDENDSGS
jgi:hypothetical protein